MVPDRIPYDYRVLLPGYSDKLAHELDLLAEEGSFERLRQHARVNELLPRRSGFLAENPPVVVRRQAA